MAEVGLPTTLVHEGFMVLAVTCGPFLLVLLVVGLVVGVLQAATQVNDPAVGFVPRALAGILVAWAFGPLLVDKLAMFLVHAATRMSGGGP